MNTGDKINLGGSKAAIPTDAELEGALMEEERQIVHGALSSINELLLIADDREKVNTTWLSSLLSVVTDRMEPPEPV